MMHSGRFGGLVFVAAGLGLAIFHRQAARWQLQNNRDFYASPFGRGLTKALSYFIPAAWVVIGGLAFLDRLSSNGLAEQPLPGIGLKEGQLVGLGAFVIGALLLAFHGRWMGLHERMLAWYSSPAGEKFLSWYIAAFGLLAAAMALLWTAGVLS